MKRITVFILLCLILCCTALADSGNNISSFACGDNSVFVILDDGKLIAWGSNGSGLIPTESHSKKIGFEDRCLVMYDVNSVAVGDKCVLAINSDRELYAWGDDGEAALLLGIPHGGIARSPVKLMDDVVYASSGYETNAAITSDGSLYTWGRDNCGSLGIGTLNGSIFREPNKVMDGAVSVFCFGNDVFAISDEGLLYCWGESFGFSSPKMIAARIVDVAKACNDCYLLLNSSNEVLLLQCKSNKDGEAKVELTPSVATNVTSITDYGYIRGDGTLWMCISDDSNTFIPSAENVKAADCCDMKYRAYVSLHTLYLEKNELKMFIGDETHAISNINLKVEPDSSGILSAIIISALIAAVILIVVEKPKFYVRLLEEIKDIKPEN